MKIPFTFGKKKTHFKEDAELSDFEKSLDELTPDDLAPAVPAGKFSLYGAVRIILIAICIGVFAYCCYLLVHNMTEYKKADDIYGALSNDFFDVEINKEALVNDGVSKLSQNKVSTAIPIFSEAIKLSDSELSAFYSEGSAKHNMEFQRMRSKLENLRSQNSDIVGFIYAPNTKISYPVTKYTDNDFYLDHSFDKKPLKSGTIFMDYRNLGDIEKNKNIVMYGHNMNNGSMFGNITKFYKNKDFFESTPIILYAFDGIYTFEVFSVYKTTYDYRYFRTEFSSDQDFLSFANEMKQNSVHTKNAELSENDILLTLSTCTNTNQAGRYALHARLTRIDR